MDGKIFLAGVIAVLLACVVLWGSFAVIRCINPELAQEILDSFIRATKVG